MFKDFCFGDVLWRNHSRSVLTCPEIFAPEIVCFRDVLWRDHSRGVPASCPEVFAPEMYTCPKIFASEMYSREITPGVFIPACPEIFT
jgi:hypothetical protein